MLNDLTDVLYDIDAGLATITINRPDRLNSFRAPRADLRDEVRRWADEILALSPTALKVLKQSLNTDTEHFVGVGQMAHSSLLMFTGTEEVREGIAAFNEKRAPDFAGYRGVK
jgi:1,4-dihydroxy-2-naphthoyl-CoA synthase